MSIRVFMVEDQPKILKNQLKLLSTFDEIDIIGTAQSGEDALEAIEALEQKPDVLLCDLGLPKMSGIDVTAKVKEQYESVEVLVFTVFDEEDKVIEAVRAGASGYLLKGAEAEKIVEALIEVSKGGSVIQPSLAKALLRHFKLPESGPAPSGSVIKQEDLVAAPSGQKKLTDRELECLQIIAKGLSNSEAAEVLSLSRATIRTHLEHIYQKLDVSNRVEAVTEGLRQGLIDL